VLILSKHSFHAACPARERDQFTNTFAAFSPDSAVPTGAMSEKQTFRSEDLPFGIPNGKSQIPKYGICNLGCEIASASEE
jgi:hypothetical protein